MEDPVLRYTPSGTPVVNTYLADDQIGKDGTRRGTSVYKLTVWDDQAEHVASSLRSGDLVIVSGKLEMQKYERPDDGGTTVTAVITVHDIGPSLRFAEVEIHKVRKEQAAPAPRKRAVRQPVVEEDEYDDEDVDDVPPSTRRAVPASTRRSRPVEDAIEEDEDDVQEPAPATTRRVVRKPLTRKVAQQPVEDEDDDDEVVF